MPLSGRTAPQDEAYEDGTFTLGGRAAFIVERKLEIYERALKHHASNTVRDQSSEERKAIVWNIFKYISICIYRRMDVCIQH